MGNLDTNPAAVRRFADRLRKEEAESPAWPDLPAFPDEAAARHHVYSTYYDLRDQMFACEHALRTRFQFEPRGRGFLGKDPRPPFPRGFDHRGFTELTSLHAYCARAANEILIYCGPARLQGETWGELATYVEKRLRVLYRQLAPLCRSAAHARQYGERTALLGAAGFAYAHISLDRLRQALAAHYGADFRQAFLGDLPGVVANVLDRPLEDDEHPLDGFLRLVSGVDAEIRRLRPDGRKRKTGERDEKGQPKYRQERHLPLEALGEPAGMDEGLGRVEDRDFARALYARLSPREREVAGLWSEGVSGADIARRLRISENTVYTLERRIRAKGRELAEPPG